MRMYLGTFLTLLHTQACCHTWVTDLKFFDFFGRGIFWSLVCVKILGGSEDVFRISEIKWLVR